MGKILIHRIFVLVMTVGYTTASASTNKWMLDFDFENNLDTSQMLWDKNGGSLITCGSLCSLNSSCRSFFYHPTMNKCLGSQSYKRGLPLGQSMKQGWNYYTKTQQCGGDYIFNKTLGLCFKIHPERKPFLDAMDACKAEGAKLVIIRNEMELLQVQDALKAAGPLEWPLIGLREDVSNGTITWKWWNGQIASYLDWELGQPDNYAGPEDCGCINPGNNNKLNDVSCLLHNSFICQKNI